MASRRNQNRIRGPHSALTDFLAANNISAAEIRDNYNRRVQQAEQEAEQRRQRNGEGGEEEEEAEAEEEVEARLEAIREERSRREQRAAKEKQKAKDKKAKDKEKSKSKKMAAAVKKRKRSLKGKKDPDDSDESDEVESDYSDALPVKKTPMPGQFENCEICEKRFTVTPYSKTGPDGGLLCSPCGKQVDKDMKKETKSAAKKPVAKKRRNIESERLDGIVRHGAKDLVQLCIEKVLKHHQDIESFDNMPEHLTLQICRLFTKHRVLNETTLPLFLRGDMREVQIYDCACKYFS
jgi:DNA repair protein RAD7